MSYRMWEVTEEHARTCVLDKTLYLYCPCSSQLKSGVVFDLKGQIAGLLSEGQYIPINRVPETEKAYYSLISIVFFGVLPSFFPFVYRVCSYFCFKL